jgi:hypothetical protein
MGTGMGMGKGMGMGMGTGMGMGKGMGMGMGTGMRTVAGWATAVTAGGWRRQWSPLPIARPPRTVWS